MPIYLVRWPDVSVSLVSADDNDDLFSKIKENNDPPYIRYKVYDGPLFIDLELDVVFNIQPSDMQYRRISPHEVDTIVDLEGISQQPLLSLGANMGDVSDDTFDEIVKWAFPYLHQCYEDEWDRLVDEPMPMVAEDGLKKVLKKEFEDDMKSS